MTLFSVIVPVYDVQAYLAECLDSVLGQDHPDFEIIAVDDHSPDDCGALLDAYAAHDDRVRVVHLRENVGLGRARNAGLERARGEYVLFLDGDDTLADGALAAMAGRLAATGRPDVLVYDYARTYWDGTVRRNQRADLLRRDGPEVFRLDDRPELLDLLQIVWNKAYRRDFVARAGLSFPPGYYEDTPWTFLALITAERIAVLDRVCLYYRQRREGGNILATVSRRHFDVFDQYRRVFDHLDAHEELARWREPLFRKMVGHYLIVLERPGRLPPDARAEFFHRASADYRARVPRDFRRPPGNQGRKYALLERGAYAALAGATRAARLRQEARGRAAAVLDLGRRRAAALVRSGPSRLPLDENLAVFSARGGRGVLGDPAAVAAELARTAPHIRRVWVVRPEAVDRLPPGTQYVAEGSARYWTALSRARYLVADGDFPDDVVKRAGQIHVQTHHGTPLSAVGLDRRHHPAGGSTDFAALLGRWDRWDYSLTASRYAAAVRERAYPCSFTTLETGCPRNDILVTADGARVRRARAALGLADGVTAFLYLPVRRPYRPDFTPLPGLERIAGALGPDVVFLVRGRPGPPLRPVPPGGGRIVDVSGHPRVEELYLAADALVTDYSPAMFDYAVLDRPIVCHLPDWEVYSTVCGAYVDLPGEPPGAVTTTPAELRRLLASGDWDSRENDALRDAFRRRYCAFDDGHAAERVVRRVFLGETALRPVVPFGERGHAPAPAKTRAANGRSRS